MATDGIEITLGITPRARFDVVDVRQHVLEHHGAMLEQFPRVLYCSYHTTAGYLDQRLVSWLNMRREGVTAYLGAFRTVFPEGAGYRHDELHLRQELSEEQRRVEPRNGDSHLAFMSAGLRTCVTYRHRPNEPVFFIDLDGVNVGGVRQRVTSILGFTTEDVVARARVRIPVTARAVGSVDLKDPCLGLFEQLQALIERYGVVKGRLHMALSDGERDAGLTINEYETLLMEDDLPEVIRNPYCFMVGQHRRRIGHARPMRTRAIPCARSLGLQRSISVLVSDCGTAGRGRLVQGRFQSPILVQWGPAEGCTRDLDVSLTQFR